MSPSVNPDQTPKAAATAFFDGAKSAWTSVFSLVLIGTFIGIGALGHDYGFSLPWLMTSTVLVWAGPAQVILISALGGGATLIEAALAVGLSSVRLLPMVVALLPVLRGDKTRTHHLLLPAHLTAVSMWVESLRILPTLPRENRLAFCNGLGLGFMVPAQIGTAAGFYLAGGLPPLLTAGLLFITPMSFVISTTRNARQLVDRIAFGLGLVIAPLLVVYKIELDLLWTGVIGGVVAYAVHRLREALR
jgi:predicted branched-subunit amino acid permease